MKFPRWATLWAVLMAIFAIGLLAPTTSAQQKCGPNHCYPAECNGHATQVDFVFVYDFSGSMSPTWNNLKAVVHHFFDAVSRDNMDATITIVGYAYSNSKNTLPRIAVPTTAITPGNLQSFKNSFDTTTFPGGYEPGLMALELASKGHTYPGFNINFRDGARRVFVLFTDEDSDPNTLYGTNQYGAFPTHPYETLTCLSRNTAPASDSRFVASKMEIDRVGAHLVRTDSFVHFVVSDQTPNSIYRCFSRFQFGSSAINYGNSNFVDISSVSAALANDPHAKDSLQAYMVNRDILSRTWNIDSTTSSGSGTAFVNTILQAIQQSVGTCQDCTEYKCSSGANKVCLSPEHICDCAGVRHGPHVRDCENKCVLPQNAKVVDCAGVCGGTATLNGCGFCARDDAGCRSDCRGRTFPNVAPPGVVSTVCPSWIKPEDIASLYTEVVIAARLTFAGTSTRDITSFVCEWFNKHKRHLTSTQECIFDAAKYANAAGVSVDSAATEFIKLDGWRRFSGVCRNAPVSIMAPPPDACGQCRQNLYEPAPFCQLGCNGQYATSQAALHEMDNCNSCVGPDVKAANPNTWRDLKKDDCGVCNGGNSAKNQCGVCFEDKTLDGCGQPNCKKLFCSIDCNDVPYTAVDLMQHHIDPCGNCVRIRNPDGSDYIVEGKPQLRHPRCLDDCIGTPYMKAETCDDALTPADVLDTPSKLDSYCHKAASHWTNPCNKCVPLEATSKACVRDCARAWGGDFFLDKCQVCRNPADKEEDHEDRCLFDCKNTPYLESAGKPHVYTICGHCVAKDSPLLDEHIDSCGRCVLSPGWNADDCKKDCSGVFRLVTDPNAHVLDSCDECHNPNDLSKYNRLLDECGLCVTLEDLDENGQTPPSAGAIVDDLGVFCGCKPKAQPVMLSLASGSGSNNGHGGLLMECDDPENPGNKLNLCSEAGQCPPLTACGTNEKGETIPVDICGRCPVGTGSKDKDHPLYGYLDDCDLCCDTHDPKDLEANPTWVVCNSSVSPCGNCHVREYHDQCGNCLDVPFGIAPGDTTTPLPNDPSCVAGCDGKFPPAGTPPEDLPRTNECNVCTVADSDEDKLCVTDCNGGHYHSVNGKPSFIIDSCDQCVRPEDACSTLGTGAIVGIAIGAVAAVALVAVAAIFAVKYAQANGLFGLNKPAADMSSGSNANPLFAGQTQTASNPLFVD